MSFVQKYTDKNVRNIKEIKLSNALSSSILNMPKGEKRLEIAKEYSKLINVFTFEYLSGDHWVVGFLVEPKKITNKLPVIIKNRGGTKEVSAWQEGHMFGRFVCRYIEWGFGVIMSQYSGNSGSEGEDEFGGNDIQDVINLKEIIDKYEHFDEESIGMTGGSRGGLMTYLCLNKVDWIRSAVVNSAPTDLEYTYTYRQDMYDFHKTLYKVDSKEELDKRSAIHFYTSMNPTPLLIMHGTSDERVRVDESLRFYEKLLSVKYPAKMTIYPGVDHYLREVYTESSRLTQEWLSEYIINKKEVPNMEPHGN